MSNKWTNDKIQFARLISELQGVGAFTEQVMQDLQESMDLTVELIGELIERADAVFEGSKAEDRYKGNEDLFTYRLQEAYKLPNGTMHVPHWDEWGDETSNLVSSEEVLDGIKIIGKWYEVADSDDIDVNLIVWWNDPDSSEDSDCSCAITIVKKTDDMVVGKQVDGGIVEAPLHELTTMPIYRRIAELKPKG